MKLCWRISIYQGERGRVYLLFDGEWGMEPTGLESTWQGREADRLGFQSSVCCSALLLCSAKGLFSHLGLEGI